MWGLTLTIFVLERVYVLLQPPPDLLGAATLPQILLDPLLVLLVAVAGGVERYLQVDVLHVSVLLAQVRYAQLARYLYNGILLQNLVIRQAQFIVTLSFLVFHLHSTSHS